MTRIINFYCAIEGHDQGRMLADILNQDDRWLESVHDYIQWLFPNREPSEVGRNLRLENGPEFDPGLRGLCELTPSPSERTSDHRQGCPSP